MTAERAHPVLRAIRSEPLLLDDRFVADRLAGALPDDVSRWARAWLVCWFATLVADERYGRLDPWDIDVPLDAVVTPKGAGDAARLRLVIDALAASGVATVEETSRGRRVERIGRVSADVFASHHAALALDWGTAVARCGGEPAAILVLRALAELVVPLDAVAAVPRRDLMARTGYQQKQVRVALRRLLAADLVAAEGEVGTTARYRFTPRALGRAWPEQPPAAGPAPVLVSAPPSNPVQAPMPAATSATGDGVRLVIGGATLTIAAGASFEIGEGIAARLELGPDGKPRLVVDGGSAS